MEDTRGTVLHGLHKLPLIVKARVFGPLLAPFRPGNIAMFHIGRSGSTVLADLLRQHPRIHWEGELYQRFFHIWARQGKTLAANGWPVDPIKLLRSRLKRAGRHYYGFEVKFFHLRLAQVALDHYLDQLTRMGFNYFIILERKNYLRTVVSSVVAHHTHIVHHSLATPPELNRIRLNVNMVQIDRDAKPLLAYLVDYQERFLTLKRLLHHACVLTLTYEDDIADDPYTGYRRVCTFLGLPPRPAAIRYGKTNPFKLSEILVNFDEVVRTLRGTRFEWMVHE